MFPPVVIQYLSLPKRTRPVRTTACGLKNTQNRQNRTSCSGRLHSQLYCPIDTFLLFTEQCPARADQRWDCSIPLRKVRSSMSSTAANQHLDRLFGVKLNESQDYKPVKWQLLCNVWCLLKFYSCHNLCNRYSPTIYNIVILLQYKLLRLLSSYKYFCMFLFVQ